MTYYNINKRKQHQTQNKGVRHMKMMKKLNEYLEAYYMTFA